MVRIRVLVLAAFGALLVLLFGGGSAAAQAPGYYRTVPQTGYRYVTPSPTYRVVPRTFAGRRAVVSTRNDAFSRYRGALRSGRDPNWATRRGLPLYKPWQY